MNAIASITIPAELPPLADAMSAADLIAHEKSIAATLGPKADTYASTNRHEAGAHIMVYPDGICGKDRPHHFNAPAWPEAIRQAYAWASTRKTVWRDDLIRRMALAVIDLTDQHGKCTERLLRGRDFTRDDVIEHHEAACVRAGEMSGNAPFRVVLS